MVFALVLTICVHPVRTWLKGVVNWIGNALSFHQTITFVSVLFWA